MFVDRGEEMASADTLDGSGFEPYACDFRIALVPGQPLIGNSRESRELLHAVFVTPKYPQSPTEIKLGDFRCVGCIVEDGLVKWGPLGCPVHTPKRSWPVRDALTALTRPVTAQSDVIKPETVKVLPTQRTEQHRFSLLELD